MSAFVTLSFQDAIARLERLSKPGTVAPDQNQKAAPKEFSSVLAELEKTKEIPSTDNKLGTPGQAPISAESAGTEVLTNLSGNEVETSMKPPSKLLAYEQLTKVSTGEQCAKPVNFTLEGAGSLTRFEEPRVLLTPPLLESEELPDAPEITAVRRTVLNSSYNGDSRRLTFEKGEIENIVSTAGKYHGVDPYLGLAVAQAESSMRHDAISKDGHYSKGVFQLLDSTAKDLVGRMNVDEEYDPYDPAMNAYLGVGYLKRLHEIFGTETSLGYDKKTIAVKSAADLEKVAVAAFNAGEGNVADAQRRAALAGKDPSLFSSIESYLPPSTRVYVDRVVSTKSRLALANKDDKLA